MDALARRGTNLMCDFIILLISSMDVSFLLNLGCSGNYMHRACSVCNDCLVSMTLLNLFPKNNNKKSSLEQHYFHMGEIANTTFLCTNHKLC